MVMRGPRGGVSGHQSIQQKRAGKSRRVDSQGLSDQREAGENGGGQRGLSRPGGKTVTLFCD